MKRSLWIERSGDVAVMSLGVVAAVLLLSGCGQQKSTSSGSLAESSTPPVATEATSVATSNGQSSGVVTALSQGSTANATTSGEGLPPEIALAELDTLVTPGQPIEVTVYGTPDVTEMSLWDGYGDRQAMVHDAAHDTWSVKYRVPLRSKQDRVGLSVTAKNESNRWRRVWVFLRVQQPNIAVNAVSEPVVGPGVGSGEARVDSIGPR